MVTTKYLALETYAEQNLELEPGKERQMNRIPKGDNWKDHAILCPCCKEPVLGKYEHCVDATQIDPAWWKCDRAEE